MLRTTCTGELMVPVVSAIKGEKIRQLLRTGETVLEIESPHNVLALERTDTGSVVFVTETGAEEIKRGTEGFLCSIVSMHRGFARNTSQYDDEWEILRVRVRLRLEGHARIADYNEEERRAEVKTSTHAIIG